MASGFGASREFLSRTTVLSSAAVTDNSAGLFQLHQHLCHIFGVDDLQAAAATLRRVQATAEAEAKKYRQETRRATEDLNQLRADLAAAEAGRSRGRASPRPGPRCRHRRPSDP